MALLGLLFNKQYIADGVLTTFAIPFSFQDSSQIFVTLTNTSGVVSAQTQAVHYNVTGTNVVFISAPTSGYTVTVYRLTPRTQIYDFVNSQPTLNESLESGLDRIVMMLQEIEASQAAVTSPTSGAWAKAVAQTIAALGTISLTANLVRQIIPVSGAGAARTAHHTTPLAAGAYDGQEVLLEGQSDTNVLTILNGGNILLTGDIALGDADTVLVYWSLSRSKWVEVARSLK